MGGKTGAFIDVEMEKRSDPRCISEVETKDVLMAPSHHRTWGGRKDHRCCAGDTMAMGRTLQEEVTVYLGSRVHFRPSTCVQYPLGDSVNQVVSLSTAGVKVSSCGSRRSEGREFYARESWMLSWA